MGNRLPPQPVGWDRRRRVLRHSVLIGRNNRSRQMYPHLIHPKSRTTVTINNQTRDKHPTNYIAAPDPTVAAPRRITGRGPFRCLYYYSWFIERWGHVVAQLVEPLSYKPYGHGFDSRWCHFSVDKKNQLDVTFCFIF